LENIKDGKINSETALEAKRYLDAAVKDTSFSKPLLDLSPKQQGILAASNDLRSKLRTDPEIARLLDIEQKLIQGSDALSKINKSSIQVGRRGLIEDKIIMSIAAASKNPVIAAAS